MRLIYKNIELSHWLADKKIGFVPTMGALHLGHFSLIERALLENEFVLVSIFVNPLQFNNVEDLNSYPSEIDKDFRALQDLGVHAVYAPNYEEVFPKDYDTSVYEISPSSQLFEGFARPGHFDGMLAVVKRLFDLAKPKRAYFGEKDAQQLFLVQKLVRDLKYPIEIVSCPIVRDSKGLALSSRNQRLSRDGKASALALFKSLSEVKNKWDDGVRDVAVLRSFLQEQLSKFPLKIIYAEIIDADSFMPCNNVAPERLRAIVAAEVEGVHLIDNLALA